MSLKEYITSIPEAYKEVFSEKLSFLYLIVGSVLFGIIYVGLPVITIPGNTVNLFFEETSFLTLLFDIWLALMIGSLLAFNIYIWKNRISKVKNSSFSLGAGGFSIIASLFANTFCIGCATALISLVVPFGTAVKLVEYKLWVTLVSTGFVLLGISISSKQITDDCKKCSVELT